MRDAGRGGSVINVSSIAGVNRGHLPGGAAYASSKAGLNTLTKVISQDFGIDLRFFFFKKNLLLTRFFIVATNDNSGDNQPLFLCQSVYLF